MNSKKCDKYCLFIAYNLAKDIVLIITINTVALY